MHNAVGSLVRSSTGPPQEPNYESGYEDDRSDSEDGIQYCHDYDIGVLAIVTAVVTGYHNFQDVASRLARHPIEVRRLVTTITNLWIRTCGWVVPLCGIEKQRERFASGF